MTCIKCGRGLKLHRSRSNGKREVWGCPARGCDYREDFELLGSERRFPDENQYHVGQFLAWFYGREDPNVQCFTDRRSVEVWEYDDNLKTGTDGRVRRLR